MAGRRCGRLRKIRPRAHCRRPAGRFTAAPSDPEALAAPTAALETSPSVGDDAEAFLEESGTQAFIVIRDDVILYERYFNGFTRDSIATSFSVAKSFVSALVGIAIEEGAIESVDDPVTAYVPELLERDERFAKIPISHLLDMTSGIHYEEFPLPNGDDTLTYYFDDLRAPAIGAHQYRRGAWRALALRQLQPAVAWTCARADHRNASGWLPQRQAVGEDRYRSPRVRSLDSEDGFEKMESGINARPIDFAKLGRLYLEGGAWEAEQVIPGDWVETSTRPGGNGFSDGVPERVPRGLRDHLARTPLVAHRRARRLPYAFSAAGNHGQFIFVSPEDQLIVVRNGERYGIELFEWLEVFSASQTSCPVHSGERRSAKSRASSGRRAWHPTT